MKTIGLIGGMSWESSAAYYRLINQATKRRLGGHHSARSLMYTVDFADVEELQQADEWDAAGELLARAAIKLERGGANVIVICANTMHLVADRVAAAVDIPLLHIIDETGKAVRSRGQETVGLIGTRYTMEKDFYRAHLTEHHGLKVVVPEEPERSTIHDIIYDELVHGRIEPASRDALKAIIGDLGERGAEAVILGCTELSFLADETAGSIPTPVLLDTTRIHAEAAVAFALSGV